jgi:hypothetical protein
MGLWSFAQGELEVIALAVDDHGSQEGLGFFAVEDPSGAFGDAAVAISPTIAPHTTGVEHRNWTLGRGVNCYCAGLESNVRGVRIGQIQTIALINTVFRKVTENRSKSVIGYTLRHHRVRES